MAVEQFTAALRQRLKKKKIFKLLFLKYSKTYATTPDEILINSIMRICCYEYQHNGGKFANLTKSKVLVGEGSM